MSVTPEEIKQEARELLELFSKGGPLYPLTIVESRLNALVARVRAEDKVNSAHETLPHSGTTRSNDCG